MTDYLTSEEALIVAGCACADDTPVVLRDAGQLESALHRPAAEMFGEPAHPELMDKAASLLQGLAINHPLFDGNKRTAWLACVTFLALHGVELRPDIDAAERLVLDVTTGREREVAEISRRLRLLAA
ncbi:type II toxin-antitoxin system death-on-curing family toxin [Streptomyces sp. I05A-00742]|uniref:type II toxin-antitoxin system death-on-curing family toxin n=1 Tax=Streptomyces sp. I05A-00742 TaxID=2732853 RepID=UPI00148996DB|nr:Fic family protein [Streptomyces sp. I05A-00742]